MRLIDSHEAVFIILSGCQEALIYLWKLFKQGLFVPSVCHTGRKHQLQWPGQAERGGLAAVHTQTVT